MSLIASISPFPWNPTQYTADKIPTLDKTFVITGGNTGIGFETCLELVKKGGTVYMLCRNQEKATDAIQRIKTQVKDAKIYFISLDLQNLKSIEKAANELLKLNKIDVLINNAGISYTSFGLTSDGIEDQFGTNHLGPFYLTKLLLPLLSKSKEPRIVNVSSIAHIHSKGINFETLNENVGNPYSRYADSKLANIQFTRECAKRFPTIFSNAVHPGVVHTEILRNVGGWSPFLEWLLRLGSRFVSLSPAQGALTTLYVATSQDIIKNQWNGEYFTCIAMLDKPSDVAFDDVHCKELWERSEAMIKEHSG